jgi:hypothetical protein
MNKEIQNVSQEYSIRQINDRYSENKDLLIVDNKMMKGKDFNMKMENIQMDIKKSKIF